MLLLLLLLILVVSLIWLVVKRKNKMATFLFTLCVLSFLSAIITGALAQTVFQQIVGAMSFVIASILLIGGAIVNAVNKLIYEVRKVRKEDGSILK